MGAAERVAYALSGGGRQAFAIGGSVYAPAGEYRVADVVVEPGVTVHGDGPTTRFVLPGGAHRAVFRVEPGARLRDVAVDGGAASPGPRWAPLVGVQGDDVVLDQVHVSRSLGLGISAHNVSGLVLDRCKVHGAVNIPIFCEISATGTGDVEGLRVERCVVDRRGDTPNEGGIQVRGNAANGYVLRDVTLTGNRVYMPATGDARLICIEAFGLVDGLTASGNITRGGSMGLSLDEVTNASVKGNTCLDFGYAGVEVAMSEHATISGNTINGGGVGRFGVIASNEAREDVTVTGNTIRGVTGVPFRASSPRRVTFTGNTLHGDVEDFVQVSGAWSVVLQGNTAYGSASSGAYLANNARVVLAGNLFEGARNSGAFLHSTRPGVTTVTLGANDFAGRPVSEHMADGASVVYT